MKLVLLFACVLFVAAERKRYDGYQVLEFTVHQQSQKVILDQLRNDLEMDFWTDTPVYGQPIHVMVPPHRLHDVKMLLKHADIRFSVIRANVQDRIDAHLDTLTETRDFDINDYNTFEDIEAELPLMAQRCHESFTCQVYSIGKSTEGRDLWVLNITRGEGRPGHFFDSTTHAREWLATSTVLYVMDHMTRNYAEDPDVADILDNYDVYFLPVVNPDGYVHSWVDDRFWRKSRNLNDGSACIGTDLNRNFEYEWSSDGSSDNPCSDTYHGSSPASELETQAVQAHANMLGSNLRSYTSVHTSGNMWMHPWGFREEQGIQCARTDDYNDLYRVAEATAQAIMATHGTTWTYGTVCETIYAASGITIDSTYQISGIKYSFTPELRGDGFDPPPSEIVPSFEEVWNGIKAMVAEIELVEGAP